MNLFSKQKDLFLQRMEVVKNASVHTLRNYRMDLDRFETFVCKFLRKEEWELSLITKRMIRANIQRPYIRFYPPEKTSGQIVFKAEHIGKKYGTKEVISSLDLEVARGDKIAVIGNNGRGKTTLLKLLTGVLPCDAGSIEVGHQVQIGYFPQNHADAIDKKSHATAFEWLKEQRTGLYDQEIRSILGKMLFSGNDAFKSVSHLSGGETARLLIGKLMLCNYNVLILDEPNNHLDLEAVSALAWALEEFKGTVIFASHDRDLIQKSATHILALEENGIRLFDGSLDEYLSVYKS